MGSACCPKKTLRAEFLEGLKLLLQLGGELILPEGVGRLPLALGGAHLQRLCRTQQGVHRCDSSSSSASFEAKSSPKATGRMLLLARQNADALNPGSLPGCSDC